MKLLIVFEQFCEQLLQSYVFQRESELWDECWSRSTEEEVACSWKCSTRVISLSANLHHPLKGFPLQSHQAPCDRDPVSASSAVCLMVSSSFSGAIIIILLLLLIPQILTPSVSFFFNPTFLVASAALLTTSIFLISLLTASASSKEY